MANFTYKDKVGLAIIAVLVCVITVAVIYFFAKTSGAMFDDLGCPEDSKIGHTIVLIDKTDPFTENQQEILKNLLAQFKQNLDLLGVREKLSVYVLTGDRPAKPRPAFEGCRPASSGDVNELIANRDFAEEEFDKKFGEPLNALLSTLLKGEREDHTYLLEMLRELSLVEEFQRDYPRRRLIIFSDMLHFSSDFSMYKGRNATLSYEQESKQKPKYFGDLVRPRFDSGVTVALYILRRETQNRAPPWDTVREFWYNYFIENGLVLHKELACGENAYHDGCIYVEP